MVRGQEPTANGATRYTTSGAGSCYAEFGMSDTNNSGSYMTCQFDGTSGGDGSSTGSDSGSSTESCNENLYYALSEICESTFRAQCIAQMLNLPAGEERKLMFCGQGASTGSSCAQAWTCFHEATEQASCGDHADPNSMAAQLSPSLHKSKALCALDTAEIAAGNGGIGDGSCIAGKIKEAQTRDCTQSGEDGSAV
jgi:hypothetical protein